MNEGQGKKRLMISRIRGLLGLLLAMAVLMETPMRSDAAGELRYSMGDDGVLKSCLAAGPNDWQRAGDSGTMPGGTQIRIIQESGCIYQIYLNGELVREKRYDDRQTSNMTYTIPAQIAECTYQFSFAYGNDSIELGGGGVGSSCHYTLSLTCETGAATQTNDANPAHTHAYTWKVTTPATATTDGTLSNICDCGRVDATQVISANSFYLNDMLTKITTAPQGATLTFSSKDWNSFPQSVMLALAGRRDLTVVFQYDYEGRTYKVTIPAGTPVHTGDNWYGPMRLVDLYDGVEITE